MADLGKIAVTPRGEYNASKIYEILDLVTDSGNSYISKLNDNDKPLTDYLAWQLSAKKGDTGTQGSKGDTGFKTIDPIFVKPEDLATTTNGTFKPIVISEDNINIDPLDYGTLYPNHGNLRAKEGYDTLFNFEDGVWKKSETKLAEAKTYIMPFANSTFPLVGSDSAPIQRTYDNRIWQLINGKIALATDIPSDDSLVWKGGQFTKENLQIILGDDVPTDVTKKYGDDLTYASITSSPTITCNFNYLKSSEKITKLVFVALSVGSINIYKVNAGVNPNNGSPFSKTLIKNANVVVGTNYISLDINGVVGDMISVDTNGVAVGYTDGGTGGYFDAKNMQNVWLNVGHVAYYFETSVTERIPANIDALKEIVKYSSDDVKRVFDDDIVEISKRIEVSRITLEGQSNALGVGYKSELSLAPFTNIQRDWSAPIDRVYIWEPFSQEYQKLQIGVNNMASWDSRFTIGAPTAFPTFGSEVGIALNFLKTNKSGLLFIDKNVGDGQPISYFQKGTAYYAEKLARKTNADKWLIDRGFQPKEVGFVWVQGESDMGSPEANYRTALNKLLSDRIADGFIKNGTRRVITQVGSTSSNYGSGVKSAKDAYVASDLKAKIVTYTNNYNSDNVHLNAVGEVNLGLQSAREILLTDNITIADL